VFDAVRYASGTAGTATAASPQFNAPAMVDAVLAELADTEGEIVLVVDDLQELRSPEALTALGRLLTKLPAGWAHAPSGRFFANAAWVSLAVIAHNLARVVGALCGAELIRATVATLRRRVFTVPGRLVRSARRLPLRLPRDWPWQTAFLIALERIIALPQRC
jgi:hypothetical protein